MKNLFSSWKTTLLGIGAFITASWAELSTLLDDDPLTNPEWKVVITAFLVLLGLGTARDNDVSSEKAGAK